NWTEVPTTTAIQSRITETHRHLPSPRTPQVQRAAPPAAMSSARTEMRESHTERASTQSHPPSHASCSRRPPWPIACTARRTPVPSSWLVMARSPNPYLLTELSWLEVERHLERERRLLVPI